MRGRIRRKRRGRKEGSRMRYLGVIRILVGFIVSIETQGRILRIGPDSPDVGMVGDRLARRTTWTRR